MLVWPALTYLVSFQVTGTLMTRFFPGTNTTNGMPTSFQALPSPLGDIQLWSPHFEIQRNSKVHIRTIEKTILGLIFKGGQIVSLSQNAP